jgi:hypothetical protein
MPQNNNPNKQNPRGNPQPNPNPFAGYPNPFGLGVPPTEGVLEQAKIFSVFITGCKY